MRPLIQNGFLRVFVKIGGVLGALFGVIFAIVGLYGIAGGTGVEFSINDRVVDGQEGGPIFLITGIVILLVGVALIYLGFKKKVVQDD
jgi:ABC-type cobalamin transport system permease subunit